MILDNNNYACDDDDNRENRAPLFLQSPLSMGVECAGCKCMIDGRYRSGMIAGDRGPTDRIYIIYCHPPPEILNFGKHKVAIGIRYSGACCLGTRYSSGLLCVSSAHGLSYG